MRIPPLTARRKARIEIIPLIDVVFFLLATFVMVSLSMVANKGISVNLPKAASGASQERKLFVTLTVTEEGKLYLDKEALTFGELPARLAALKRKEKEIQVFIQADEAAPFGRAIQALDEVRKAGISKVAIQTAQIPPQRKP